MTPITVVIVDDHVVFREGLRALLNRLDTVEIIGEAGTTEDAVATVAAVQPDVVLMDLHLPGAGGAAATKEITTEHSGVAVLVLTMHSNDGHLQSALAAGARGYILKDADPESIIRALSAAHHGQLIFDPGISTQVLRATSMTSNARPFPSLTEREYEILERLARGLRNDAISVRMGISMKTVQNNVSNILLKLGATDRAQAVAIARDAGLGTQ